MSTAEEESLWRAEFVGPLQPETQPISTATMNVKPTGVFGITDKEFLSNVSDLYDLYSFLLKQGVDVDDGDLAQLLVLRYEKNGRSPSAHEHSIYHRTARALYKHLTAELRFRYSTTQSPHWINRVAIFCAVIAIICCSVAFYYGNLQQSPIAIAFAFWTGALGVLGAAAFVSMNILAIQNDITFDFCNKRLTWTRVTMGGIFGLIIGFPVAFPYFKDFVAGINKGPSKEQLLNATSVLLPFVLGFSTTVVISVLARMTQSVQALFGTQDVKPTPPAVPSKPSPPGPPAPIPPKQ